MALLSVNYNIYEKNNKYLYIFPDIPYWIVVSSYGKIILNQFFYNDSLKEVKDSIKNIFSSNWYIYEKYFDVLIDKLYTNFENAGIFNYNNKRIQTFTKEIDSIGINITKNCNLQCKYCYADSGEISCKSGNNIEYISKFLKEARKFVSNSCYVQITGGEPFLEKTLLFETLDLLEKLEYYNITMNTNGILISDDIIEQLLKYKNIKNITISVDGEKEVHDNFRGKGSYEKAIQAIKKLKDKDFTVTASMTVHEKNLEYIETFLDYCKNNNIIAFNNPMFPIGRCKENDDIKEVNIYNLFLKLKDMYKLKKYSSKDFDGTFLSTIILPLRDLKKKHYCGMGLSSVFLDVDGNVYPCANTLGIEQFLCGNICDSSFEDIWLNSKKYNYLRNCIDVDTNEDCKSCELKYICAGFCRGMNYQSTGKLNTKSIWCNDLKETILEAMWTINEFPELFHGSKDNFA